MIPYRCTFNLTTQEQIKGTYLPIEGKIQGLQTVFKIMKICYGDVLMFTYHGTGNFKILTLHYPNPAITTPGPSFHKGIIQFLKIFYFILLLTNMLRV